MKKKLIHGLSHDLSIVHKIWLTMRLIVLLFFVSLMHVSASVYSQKTKLNLKVENATLQQVFALIQDQSEFDFFYKNEQIPSETRVSVDAKNESIENILNNVLKDTGLKFGLVDKDIVIIPSEPVAGQQQKKTVSGKVVDSSGATLPGVSVVVKGTTIGVITDNEGKFSLANVPDNATLQFSFVGMKGQELAVGDKTSINVTLEEETIGIEEVVAIGYGTVRKKDLTGSVASINSKDLVSTPATNVVEFLRGRISGFNASLGTNAKEQMDMQIRGRKSINAGNSPLIVLDGVIYYGDISDINPRDIENIQVLKDASSCAVFGAKAASGVVILTTKRGTEQKPTINFTSSYGIATVADPLRPRSPEDYLNEKMWYQKTSTAGVRPSGYFDNPNKLPDAVSLDTWRGYSQQASTVSNQEIWAGRIGLTPTELKNFLAGKTIDWFSETFNQAARQDYNLSISGKTDRINYYTSLGFVDNDGIVFGDKFQNFRFRSNLDAKIADWLKIGTNIQFANRNERWPQISDVRRSLWMSPYGDFKDANGQYVWSSFEDGEAGNVFLNQTVDYLKMRRTFNSNIYSLLTLPYGFTFQTTWSNRFSFNQDYSYAGSWTNLGGSGGSSSRSEYTLWEYTLDHILKWNKIIGSHRFDFTMLYSVEKYQDWLSSESNKDFSPSEALGFHGIGYGSNPVVSGNDKYRTGVASMARLNYSFKDRYFFSGSIRRDGYSEFGQSNPYATFPSIGLGWLASEESFCKIQWINQLKFRLSWGINGNRDVPLYAALSDLSASKYLYENTKAVGVAATKMANKDLKWEQTEAFNAGIDFGFLKNRISGTIEVYKMRTTDLLVQRSLPTITGYSNVWSNLGEVQNKGLEVNLNTEIITSKEFNWSSSLIFYFNRNKINRLYGNMIDLKDAGGNIIGQKEADDKASGYFIGYPLDAIYDYNVLGVYQLGEKTEAAKYGKQPGDFKLQDVNDDGKLLPDDDKVFQGQTTPKYRMSFSNTLKYKNFELSFMLSGMFDYKNQVGNLHQWDHFSVGRTNHYDLPYWTPENPINSYARLFSSAASPTFRYWDNNSFVRLENLSLGYDLPKNLLNPLKIKNAKLFLNGTNLLTVTNWVFFDPETMTWTPKIITLGINVSL